MVNLKGNPFYLTDEAIVWINKRLKHMSLEEKVGQLFCVEGESYDEQTLKSLIDTYKPGGIMYRPGPAELMHKAHKYLQEVSRTPLLIAANLESGGNGIVDEGTFFGKQMQVAASNDEDMAYKLGKVAGREGRSVGCNWTFSPVVDLDLNYQNPITNTRTYGSDVDKVLGMASKFMKGIQDENMAVSIKHWPGDGVDGRDQHLHPTVNSMSCEEWDASYGKIYKSLIDQGARTVMAAHIAMPAYSRVFNEGIKDEDIMPATFAPEIMQNLLRGQLGFNGLVITDATVMGGFMMPMKREDAVPKTIAAGCDMFLFVKNIEEDFKFMKQGVEKGIITMERLNEAVLRILALKASLGLPKLKEMGTLVPDSEGLNVIRCEEHVQWARACANKSITLVKDSQGMLPLQLEKHKNILVFISGADEEGAIGFKEPVSKNFIQKLEAEGFNVTIFNKKMSMDEIIHYYETSIETFRNTYDAVIYFSNLETYSNQTIVRLEWCNPFGFDMPWFIQEVPTMFISVANPYHLQDVPLMKTYINAYSSGNNYVIESIIEKLMGRSSFVGVSPVEPTGGCW